MTQDVDAIVAAIPQTLELKDLAGRKLLAAAGADLDEAILAGIYRPRPGDTFALPGFRLPARHIIFTVVPDWQAEFECDDRHLIACYRGAMQMATAMGLRNIAFPGILLPGNKGFPPRRAVRLALKGICERLTDALSSVRIVCEEENILKDYADKLAA